MVIVQLSFLLSLSNVIEAEIAPTLGDGSAVDWWFIFKLNAYAYPGCSTKPSCDFGGTVQDYKYGYSLQYLQASSSGGTTKEMELKTDCLGSGEDPVAKTFAQIYSGTAPNYVIWNDQFYGEPVINLNPPCKSYCGGPWGHSKGAIAWDKNGNGFIMQVTTPDWPGSGDSSIQRETQGNTLGCNKDDNVLVSQHFFSLKLTAADTKAVLVAMRHASVVTDPSNTQLVKLTQGPSDLQALANGLGSLSISMIPYQATLSTGAKLIAKPHALHVPPFQMVSSLLGLPLRTATWWKTPAILSSKSQKPGCWSSDLDTPQEVQIATSGQWKGTQFNLTGGLGANYNHAKLAYSLEGNHTIMADMNQMGSYMENIHSCSTSQNGRGGLFFVLEDATLHSGFRELMTGSTAPYYGDAPAPSNGPSPGPSPSPAPSPSPDGCGGAGVDLRWCWRGLKDRCVYVYAKDASKCGLSKYGCYALKSLPPGCPEKPEKDTSVFV